MRLFIPITKIDEEKRLVYGTVTEETMDKSGEVMDYLSSKPFYEKWSEEFRVATDGKSVGNLRVMHTSKVAGKLTALDMDDLEKRISCVAKVVDDGEWEKCLEGVYTAFSQGGRYVRRWTENGMKRYTADPAEISLVDNPSHPSAHFELAKSDGTVETRKFKMGGTMDPEVLKKMQDEQTEALKSTLEASFKALGETIVKAVKGSAPPPPKPPTGDEGEPTAKVLELQCTNEELTKRLDEIETTQKLAKRKIVLDAACAAGKIKVAERKQWEKDYDVNPAMVERMLKSMSPVVPIGERRGSGADGDDQTSYQKRNDLVMQKAKEIMEMDKVTKSVAIERAARIISKSQPELWAQANEESLRLTSPAQAGFGSAFGG